MCGICGILSRRSIEQNQISQLESMRDTLIHRGPDSQGLYRGDNIGLAIRRLSIIDVAGGDQPLFDETKSLALVANAEIYNYVELTAELKKRGHIFRTGSDCETILHLYQEMGIECLKYLRGMFAFALWDSKKRSLFLARDRLGEKPLYLYEEEDSFIFASEFKALKKVLPADISLDLSAVDLFFHYQYVPEPGTLISGVRKLNAAHYMHIKIDNWDTRPKRYWNIQDAPPLEGNPAEKLRDGLQELVPFILRSDVPVGIALSGGIDSSAIASIAAKKYRNTLYAFSVGYSGVHACDERSQARELARDLGLHFQDVEISTNDFVRDLPDLIRFTDDPIADTAAYGYYCVMRLAHQHNVPVMLSGFGGDELFWGYPWVKEAVEKSLAKSNSFLNRFSPKNRMIFYDIVPDFKEAHKIFPYLYTKEFSGQIDRNNIYAPFTVNESWEPVDIKICQLIFDTWLTSNCIALGDRLSMASSVEMRLPLLDYKFIEIVLGLRKKESDYKLPPKEWLKDSLRGILPDAILNRPKRGFRPPLEEWIEAALNKYASFIKDAYLVKNRILERKSVINFINSAIRKRNNLNAAYKILVLEMWCREFLM